MFVLPNPDYETHPRYREQRGKVDDELRREALAKFLPHFEGCYQRHLTAPKLGYDVRIGEGDGLLRQLQETGCGVQPVSAERKSRLLQLAEPFAKEVHEKLSGIAEPRFKHTQFVFDRKAHGEIYDLIEEIFSAEHVDAAASAYAGGRLLMKEVTVQVNTDRLTQRQYGQLDADGLPPHRTGYMHIDSALWPNVKVLIYLSEVTPDTGPFRYVEGSHRMVGDFELMVRKVNDRQNIHGETFLALPEPFRMYTLFGDEIDPDSEAARGLLARERAYDDGKNDLILFDFNGVHRGGFVRQGHRYMIQCHFEKRTKVQKMKSSVLGVEQDGEG